MISPALFLDTLKGLDVTFFTGVPDSLLKSVCQHIDVNLSAENHIITANEGAAGVAGRSTGIRVELPFEQDVNPFVKLAFEHKTFFTRLHHFVLASDAFVVAPGGIGTVLETMMIWQLLQVRHIQETPLILVGRMWPGLVEWARDAMLSTDPPLANPEDFALPQCVATADEAIASLRGHIDRWRAADLP